jgi:uncharacterized protein (DUF2345 family)
LTDTNKRFPEGELTAKQMVPTQEFGLLKTWEWPDGTIVHLNTKKGEENMRVYHSSGTYSEFRTDGTSVHFTSNNNVSYQKGGVTITYDHNSDTKGMGQSRISVSHDTHIEVAKNASIVVNGQTDLHSTGHLKVSAAGDLSLSTGSGSIVLAAERDIEMKSKGGRILMHAEGGAVQITSKDGDIHSECGGDIVNVAQGDMKSTIQGNITDTAQGKITENAQGDIVHKTAGDLYSNPNKNHHAKAGAANKATPDWVSGALPAPDS